MKIRNLILLVVGGLLTAFALGGRRTAGGAGACRGVKQSEHELLHDILEKSVIYNDALYERVRALEEVSDPEARPAMVEKLVRQNQQERAEIDELRESLLGRLGGTGRTFADVEGFDSLISHYRRLSLIQQKRHLLVYERVRAMSNVPSTPELHAYLKLGYREETQKQADTAARLRTVIAEQRDIINCASSLLKVVTDKESADEMPEKLLNLGEQYKATVEMIRMYRDDDPLGAAEPISELKALYAECVPELRQEVTRLRGVHFYDNDALAEVMERLLP